MRYIIYDIVSQNAGRMLRIVGCPPAYIGSQIKDNEYVMKALNDVNDVTQKIEFDGLNFIGQPINPKVVDKTPAEIALEKSPEIPEGEKGKFITKDMWQNVLDRLAELEKPNGIEK